jgi:hypothetical protein
MDILESYIFDRKNKRHVKRTIGKRKMIHSSREETIIDDVAVVEDTQINVTP